MKRNEKHPELVVAFMKGMIKVERWADERKRAAARGSPYAAAAHVGPCACRRGGGEIT